MIKIPLTQGQFAVINEKDYDIVSGFKWCLAKTGYKRKQRYAVSGGNVRMHRLIMRPPKNMEVDHINGNGLDNRRENLRICTHHQNMMNVRRISKTSQYKGVRRHSNGMFEANIKVNGVRIYLGHFKNVKAAAFAYDFAAKKHFGSFAYLNFKTTIPQKNLPENAPVGVLVTSGSKIQNKPTGHI